MKTLLTCDVGNEFNFGKNTCVGKMQAIGL